MKIKKVLGVVALLSSMPFAFNANNLTHVVCAEENEVVTTDTVHAIVTTPESEFKYMLYSGGMEVYGENGFEAYNSTSNSIPNIDNTSYIDSCT